MQMRKMADYNLLLVAIPEDTRKSKPKTVRATTRSGYMMTSPTSLPGSLLRLEVSFPHTTLKAVTLDNEKSGV